MCNAFLEPPCFSYGETQIVGRVKKRSDCMFLTFENGWEGVWLAYGGTGVLLLDAIICTLTATVILWLLYFCAQKLGWITVSNYLHQLIHRAWYPVLKSLIVTECLIVTICMMGFMMKG